MSGPACCGPQSQTVGGPQRASPYCCSARTVIPERQLQGRLAASPRSYDWHVPCAASSAASDGPRAWLLVHRDVPRQGFKNITLTKNTVTPGRQLQVRLATSPRSFDWHVTVPRPGPPPVCCQCTCRGKVSNLKPQLFSNFKFNIRDSTSKLETIGINLPVNLNLNLLR